MSTYIYSLIYILKVIVEKMEHNNVEYPQKNYTLYTSYNDDLYLLQTNDMYTINSPVYRNFINNTRKYI